MEQEQENIEVKEPDNNKSEKNLVYIFLGIVIVATIILSLSTDEETSNEPLERIENNEEMTQQVNEEEQLEAKQEEVRTDNEENTQEEEQKQSNQNITRNESAAETVQEQYEQKQPDETPRPEEAQKINQPTPDPDEETTQQIQTSPEPIPQPSSGSFYTSSHHMTKYYYPEDCEGWENLSEKYLKKFDSLEELLSQYNRTLSPKC